MSRVDLRPGVDGDLEALGPDGEERLGDVTPLPDRQEHALAGRAAGEETVHATRREEPHERPERVGVEGATAVRERRDRRRDRSVQAPRHRVSLGALRAGARAGVHHRRASRLRIASQMLRPGCSATRRMNHGYQCVP